VLLGPAWSPAWARDWLGWAGSSSAQAQPMWAKLGPAQKNNKNRKVKKVEKIKNVYA